MDNNSDNNSEKKQSSDDVGVAKSSAAPAAAKDKAVDQRQLREFNEWLARWINYQGLLAKYWKTRAQYEQRLAAGDVAEKTSSSSSKWDIRFQELCEYKVWSDLLIYTYLDQLWSSLICCCYID
jgi:hypothetical protein